MLITFLVLCLMCITSAVILIFSFLTLFLHSFSHLNWFYYRSFYLFFLVYPGNRLWLYWSFYISFTLFNNFVNYFHLFLSLGLICHFFLKLLDKWLNDWLLTSFFSNICDQTYKYPIWQKLYMHVHICRVFLVENI